jgi:hypothetical protein
VLGPPSPFPKAQVEAKRLHRWLFDAEKISKSIYSRKIDISNEDIVSSCCEF